MPFRVFRIPLQWRQNGRDSVSNHQPHDCLLNRLFRRRSKKTSKLRVTGLCVGNSPGTDEFPAQRVSDAENVSIWWRHRALWSLSLLTSVSNGIMHQWDISFASDSWCQIIKSIVKIIRSSNVWLGQIIGSKINFIKRFYVTKYQISGENQYQNEGIDKPLHLHQKINRSQRHFAYVTTVTLLWRAKNFVQITRVHFTPEHYKFCSNFEFDRNTVSGMGARSSTPMVPLPCIQIYRCFFFSTYIHVGSLLVKRRWMVMFKVSKDTTTFFRSGHLPISWP